MSRIDLRLPSLAFLLLACLLAGCDSAPKGDVDRKRVDDEVRATVDIYKQVDPSIQAILDKSVGYAVFPEVTKGAVGVGGAYGTGALIEAGQLVGYCDLTQATIGLQLGGQRYSELIVFSTREAFDAFKAGQFAFAAQASAIALEAGSSSNLKYENGAAVLTLGQGGLMFEASIGGQRFSYQAK